MILFYWTHMKNYMIMKENPSLVFRFISFHKPMYFQDSFALFLMLWSFPEGGGVYGSCGSGER